MELKKGEYVTIYAPDGEAVEGWVTDDVQDAHHNPFYVRCEITGGRTKVTAPWDCEIQRGETR